MIRVRNVSRSFGKTKALYDLTLTIAPGERVALVGTNGSGKTTLIRAMCGLLQFEGEIELFGHSVTKHPQKALASIAYVPQIAPPLDAPVSELIRAYCAVRDRSMLEVEANAAKMGLEIQSIRSTRVRDLSGGMKQKLLASLALAVRSQILVCDEPTANLDAQARQAFFTAVQARPADSILILCSHRLDEVRQMVERAIELKDGHIESDGPAADLVTDEEYPTTVRLLQ